MGAKWGRIGIGVLGPVIAAAACSVGTGSPDGWRYLRAGSVAVAHPKAWQESAAGAVLRGADGRADAGVTVMTAGPAAGQAADPAAGQAAGQAGAPGGAGQGTVPADARQEEMEIDGRPAQVFSYAGPVADGRGAGQVEVRAVDRSGRAVVLRAWVVNGAGGDPALLREIVNSIEFTSARPR
jgi:hypothetical protein